MSATPYFAPSYWTAVYFPPKYTAGGPRLAPSPGTISVATANGVDTITYTNPTAGSNAIAGTQLLLGYAAGAEKPTPVMRNSGTGGGTFQHATPRAGMTHYYVVQAVDVLGVTSVVSNEVYTLTPRSEATPTAPVSGLLAGAAGLTYWAYFPAPGAYVLNPLPNALEIQPTGQPIGGLVVAIKKSGISTISIEQLASGQMWAVVQN